MKRFWLSILMLASIFCLCLAFAACDNGGNTGNSGNESFTPTECTVTYDANGGMFEKDTIFIQTVKMNSVLTAPTSPTRPNYIFSGWAKDKNGLEMWDFSKEKVSGDITLYATWTQQSAAILSVDGARIENNNILMLVSQDTDFVRLAEKVVCSDDSYWQLFYDALGVMEISTKIATSTDGSLKNGNNIFYIVVSSQDKSQTNTYILTIHRQYLVTISYIANNLLYKENVILTGSELTEDYDIPCTVKGYTFHGWNHSENIGDIIWNPAIFTASLTANQYKLFYDPNGGNGNVQEQTVKMDATVDVAPGTLFTRNNYTLKEFNTQSDGEGESVRFGSSFKFDFGEDTTLYAIWECNFAFTESNEGVTITKCNHYDALVDLTEGLDGKPIVAISSLAFKNNTTLRGINIPNSVKSIGEAAFSGCSKLESLTIPFVGTDVNDEEYGTLVSLFSSSNDMEEMPQTLKTVIVTNAVSLGQGAFLECANVQNIILPNTLKEIGTMAFAGSGITAIAIPNSVTKTDGGIFAFCTSLRDVTLSKNITSLPAYSYTNKGGGSTYLGFFHSCTSLTSISLQHVTDIGEGAFIYSAITNIELPNARKIAYGAFMGCENLKMILLPETLEEIGDEAFSGSGLTSIKIPNNVTKIGGAVFASCGSLRDVTLGENITSLPAYSYTNEDGGSTYIGFFHSCASLTSISLQHVTDIGEAAFAYSGITEIDLPNVETIRMYAFAKSAVTNIDLPKVKTIAYEAFWYCENLKTIDLVETLEEIGDEAFYGSGLTSIKVPNSVTSIGKSAFAHCRGLTSITIPDSVTDIGEFAFDDCGSLESVYYMGTADEWNRISISDYNNYSLKNAKRYYYSAEENYDGQHWHYDPVTNQPVVWTKENA